MFELDPDISRTLYASSFLVMGTAILARASAFPNSGIRNRLLALGTFGLFHAAGTWFPILGFSPDGGAAEIRAAIYITGYVSLFYFAFGWDETRPRLGHCVAALAVLVWAVIGVLDLDAEMTQELRRMTAGMPASAFAAIAIARDRNFRFASKFSERMKWIVVAGFATYSLLQFPGAADSLHFAGIAVPVFLARVCVVVGITLATLTLLNRFDAVLREQNRTAFAEVGQKLTSVMQISKLGAWEQSLATGEIVWSEQLYRMLGLDPAAAEGSHAALLEHVHPEDRETLTRTLADARADHTHYDIHYRIITAGNRVCYIREAGNVLVAPDGTAHKLLGILLDVTELTEARIEAERASAAKSNFLANLSHELRTPLNAIIGFAEVMEMGLKKENVEQYAGHIRKSGRHLLSLINDILDLSKISAGKWTLHETPVDVGKTIHSSIELVKGSGDAAGLEIAADLAEGLPPVLGDERSLEQILINLLSNAMKNTPQGGQIKVFARCLSDGGFAFGVEDNGVGIAESEQGAVFEAFAQAERDPKRAAKGTGLGLPIVSGLAAAHGGHVRLQSRIGAGTCVTVVLPAARVLSANRLHAA